MKKLLWIAAVAIIGYLIYTQFVTPLSDQAKEVKQLEKRFNEATGDYIRAVRTAGEIGLATVSDAEDAIKTIRKVKTELEDMKKRLEEDDAIKRADKLEAKIKEFYQKNDLE